MAKKILLADDSVTMRKVFEMTFAAEDATITAVASGSEAISRAREMKPDVVVADLSMSGKNAYDVCAELKADPALAGIPVLILHGSSAGYDEAKARSVKADGEIAKPFETQALIEKLELLMSATSAPQVSREPMGPITSLSSPIEALDSDILIDTEEPPKPAIAEPSAPPPVRPPVSPPAPPAGFGKPSTTPPPTPPAFVPPAPPPRPPAFLAPQVPPKPSAAPPKSPPPKAVPVARPESLEVEITIEAEPLAEGSKATELPSFDGPVEKPAPVIEPKRERPSATILGLGKPDLPAPPAGLPPPPVGLPPPPSGLPLPAPTAEKPALAPRSAIAVPAVPALPPPVAAPRPEPLVVVAPPAVPERLAPPVVAEPAPAVPLARMTPPPVVELPPLEPGRPYEPVVYDAIAKLSREVIERIVWEVVPDLAERIIREELDRLVEGRRAR